MYEVSLEWDEVRKLAEAGKTKVAKGCVVGWKFGGGAKYVFDISGKEVSMTAAFDSRPANEIKKRPCFEITYITSSSKKHYIFELKEQ